jgi:tetratricopeptide (TPR) repeat protein
MMAICVLLFFMASTLEAQAPASFPVADPQGSEYAQIGRAGTYSWEDLTRMSLWASGADPKRAPAYEGTIRAAVMELRGSAMPEQPKEQGEYLLSFMHGKFLKSYSAYQTRIDTILENGRYNCVSSAVLYMILAVSLDMRVDGVMTKDHAFISLKIGTESIDVETTNRYGFDPGSRKDFLDAFGNTGFAYVPAKNYRDRTVISPVELVSLIFINRLSDLETRGRYDEALPLAANRAALLAGRTNPVSSSFFTDPNQDLTDRLLKHGSDLLNRGKEQESLDWMRFASPRYPDKRWQDLSYAALNNLLSKYLRADRVADARAVLRKDEELLTSDQKKTLEALIADMELFRIVNGIRSFDDAEAALLSIKDAEPLLEAKRITELRTFALLKGAEALGKGKHWLEGIAFIEDALARYGKNAQLENSLRSFRANRVAELHNGFAALFNRRDYEAAFVFIRKALEEFPDNRQLRSDLSMAEKARQP